MVDALGRLTQVFEDPLGLNYETDYTHDALDNLIRVDQKGGDPNSANWRTRTFTYDSLSRLLCASNPENSSAACPATATSTYTTGTAGYAYDADSNLITKTALAPNQTGTATVITCFGNWNGTTCDGAGYDALNRVTKKSYSDGVTPAVQFGYDGVAPTGCATAPPTLTDSYPVNRRTAMCDGAGAESWSHDIMGRVLTDSRTTNSVTKNTIYTYSPYLDGSINTITYPSGRILTYSTGTAERLLAVQDNSSSVYYASSALYAPQGALSSLTNGPNLYSTYVYNSRFQPCWLYTTTGTALATNSACTATATTGNIRDFKLNFSLGASDNGNVVGITNNRDTTRSQAVSYDSLNRIATAETTSTHTTSPANCWGEAYFYDNLTTAGGAWGNLTTVTSPSSAYTGCTSESLSVTALTNNRLSGFGYDSPGNLNGGSGVSGISYNAENQLVTAAGVTYKYDGDGHRVYKSSGNLYWYGIDSDPLDETDLSGNLSNEYLFFGGQRIARRDPFNNVFYYFSDHLGTSRTIAEVPSGQFTAALCYDADFYPFGGERAPIANTCSQNYKFTGKERDIESALDYFGARYNASNFGRFMSPDPENAGADDSDPQSWNAYAYVMNDPLNGTDPDGRDPCTTKDNDPNCKKKADTTVVVTADAPGPSPLVRYSFRVIWENAGGAAQRANDYLHAAYQAVVNSRATCVAAATLAGATAAGLPLAKAGGAGGAAVGAIAGGGVGDEVTIPAGSGIGAALLGGYGAIKGGQVGYALGQAVCSVGTGGGGGGGSGNGGTTQHGAQRMAERGFTPEEIANTKTGTQMTQADGASVFVKGLGHGKYNVVIEGEGGFVTGMKNLSGAEVRALAEKYGWH